MLVCRSAVDASAGTIADQIVDGLFEGMLRYHAGWWMLGVDPRILYCFYAALFPNSEIFVYVDPVLVPCGFCTVLSRRLEFVRFFTRRFFKFLVFCAKFAV